MKSQVWNSSAAIIAPRRSPYSRFFSWNTILTRKIVLRGEWKNEKIWMKFQTQKLDKGIDTFFKKH